VDRVLLVPAAVFFVFYSAGVQTFVLCRRIITALALGTFQRYNFSHCFGTFRTLKINIHTI